MSKNTILAIVILSGLLSLTSIHYLEDSGPSFTYKVSLLSGEEFSCKDKKFYKTGATEGAIILAQCSNGGNYFLENYALDNSCFEDCAFKKEDLIQCQENCARESQQDINNIELKITELSSL